MVPAKKSSVEKHQFPDHTLETLHTSLIQWYRENARSLAWRNESTSAWGTLVCEVMSQQTPVSRVEPAWLEWMKRWPEPADLAAASTADVLRMWGKLGYPRRALRLQNCAQQIVDEHDGQLPQQLDELLSLDGIGPYTAAAVCCFSYQQPVVVVDTNIRRVLTRFLVGVDDQAAVSAAKDKALGTAALPVAPDTACAFNQAIMEFGALVCQSKKPQCDTCVVNQLCEWNRAGRPEFSGKKRPGQKFVGTDRQVRGLLMDVARGNPEGAKKPDFDAVWPDDVQRDRAFESLLADGLLTQLDASRFGLPA